MLATSMLALTVYTERKMEKAILDVTTGELTFVSLTQSEISDREKIEIELNEKAQQLAKDKAEAEVKRLALLEKLGITEEEAKLLLS